jgi:hypothetical protein
VLPDNRRAVKPRIALLTAFRMSASALSVGLFAYAIQIIHGE